MIGFHGFAPLVPLVGAMLPQRRKALTECLGFLGEQTPGKAVRAFDVGGPPLHNQGRELRAPASERLIGLGQSLQDHEVLVGAETVAQPLSLRHPQPHELRPQRLGELHLVAVLHDPLAKPVERVGADF